MRFQRWYSQRTNGDWEHQHGIKIETLDNPGWRMEVDLVETYLAGRPFVAIEREAADNDWVRCWLEGTQFHAAGGAENLTEMVEIFLEWAEAPLAPNASALT